MISRNSRKAARFGRIAPLSGALALTLFSGLAVSPAASTHPMLGLTRSVGPAVSANVLLPNPVGDSAYYTVVLREEAVASYAGGLPGLPVPARRAAGATRGKLDMQAPATRAYATYLENRQVAFLSDINATLGRQVEVMARMQHALNAVIVALTAEEAAAIALRDDVLIVEREEELHLTTDVGPTFIGAPTIWNGLIASGAATRGEGIVVGIIDSGINWESPSFAAVGPVNGHAHVNPNGSGNFLGNCATGLVDAGRCNDKLIGIYNFAQTNTSGTDNNGHGSHTASTVAGNVRSVTFGGGPFQISGVAPHANVISYLACPSTCPTTATTQSVNQAVIDGVDVINFSISGGTSPWTDTTSVAFRNANAAGVFVAASAGNTSTAVPDPQGNVNHLEPWVETVAASTHNRTVAVRFDLTGQTNPPANTQNLPLKPGAAPLPTANLVDVPLIKSPGFANGSTDGCSAYPANTFTRLVGAPGSIFGDGFETDPVGTRVGGVAVLNLDGTASNCASGVRRTAALNAGAVGVIFVDVDFLNLGASGTTWAMRRSDWNNVEAGWNPAQATVSINVASAGFPAQGDVIAGFSFRGPRLIGGQGVVKPDITGPGVDILAVGAASVVGANGVYLESGTSMSGPHLAGSAALIRALQPTWTPPEVKSALNLSANNFGAINQDGSPVRPWDYGSGRVNLEAAANVGLVMDETPANFLAANPAAGGNISTLNLASMARFNAIGSTTFTRTFRRVRSGTQTYNLTSSGYPMGAVQITPASFMLAQNGTQTVTVTVQPGMLTSNQWTLGEVALAPAGGNEPNLHLPLVVFPGGPAIAVDPTSISASSSSSVVSNLTISNTGNPTLNWQVQPTGSATIVPFNTTNTTSGQLAGTYITGPQCAGASCNFHWSQNFDIGTPMRVTTLRANGFNLPSTTALSAANTPSITFSVYADNAGEPAGAPPGVGAPSGLGAAPLWTFTGAINAANGITTTGGALSLNLLAANVAATPLNLTTGRYWMTVTPTTTSTAAQTAANPLWAWYTSPDTPVGNLPRLFAPHSNAAALQPAPTTFSMLSGFIQGSISCELPAWVQLTTTAGSLGFEGSQTIPVQFNAGSLDAGTYFGNLCISSNATNAPVVPVPLSFTVTVPTAVAPTLSKAFVPTSIETGAVSTLTISLGNGDAAVSTLSADLVDSFPAGLVVAATPNASTTCGSGSVTATAGSGSVSFAAGATIPAAGSCTVSVDVTSPVASSYANSIPVGGLQTSTGANGAAANATLTVTAPATLAPTLAMGFGPASVSAGTPSVLTLTLGNPNPSAATLTANLVDSLPAGLLVAPTPGESTTCTGGTVTAAAGSTSVSLGAGAQIPAAGSCAVTVNVRAVSPGTFVNTIAAGALQTDQGNSDVAATSDLEVTAATFPAPYCTRTFSSIEPITLVTFAGINNSSTNVLGAPALQNFLAVQGNAAPGATYVITVKGNSDGNFVNHYRAYIDWNQDGVFDESAAERYELGTITNSTGLDALSTSGVISVPANATLGSTRMRVVKNYNAVGAACGTPASTFGQAEDYTLLIDPSAPAPVVPIVSKSFATDIGTAGVASALTVSLTLANGTTPETLTADLVDTLPAGMTVATPANASTTCSGTVTAVAGSGSITLGSGATIPAAGCTVTADVVAAAAGILTNTIPAGALQTTAGNSQAPATARFRALAAGQPSYSVGFEAPFTTGNVSGQQGWGILGTSANSQVSAATPFAGTQHLRVTSNTAATGPGAISPTQPVGTSAFSVLRAKLRVTRITNGATYELNPQDPLNGTVSSRIRFDRGAGRAILIPDFSLGVFVDTGAQWPLDTYFDLVVKFNRSAGSMEVCVDGTTIYTGTNAVSSPYIGNVVATQVSATGSTASNFLNVDDLLIDNTDTPPACGPAIARPAQQPVLTGEKISSAAVDASASRD